MAPQIRAVRTPRRRYLAIVVDGPISQQFVGRTQELATIERAVSNARRGVPSVLLVGGDAGIGKSTLIAEAARQANVDLYLGRCMHLGGVEIALVPLADLLRQIRRSAPDIDPEKKYPVIESIYAGPQGSFVPKSFGGGSRSASMADLGFIVVQIDGMGTANRSKAFHDVCWHNLKDAGFPDRILWHKAVAEKYPYIRSQPRRHLRRLGGRAKRGGRCAVPPRVLQGRGRRAAAATTTAWTRPRGTSSGWATQSGPQYAECSNIDNAARLQGKLMLIVGELDDNVPTGIDAAGLPTR